MRQFQFTSTVEEIEIAGKVYQLKLDDQSILEYQKAFEIHTKKANELKTVDESNLTSEEQELYFQKAKNLMKDTVEKLFGEGTFEEIYKAAGESTLNMAELFECVTEIMNEVINRKKETKINSYLKKKR
jgi:hypothetical protein